MRHRREDLLPEPRWRRLLRRLPPGLRAGGRPVVAGRVLVLVTTLLVLLTTPLLVPTGRDLLVVAASAAGAAAVLAGSLLVPWRRLPAAAATAFPLLVMAGLALLSRTGVHVDGAYAPLFVLCFVFTGLVLVPRTGWALLPAAVPLHLVVAGGPSAPAATRTVVAACVWIVVSEVLADLVRRQRAATDVLRRDARTDPLTTVGNRRDLEARMRLLAPGDSVVVVDLDHFKQLNDSRGHACGDEVLRDFGALLARGLRRGDHAARFGGEEFVLLLPATPTSAAVDVVERLREAWAAGGGATTFSAGCATLDESTSAQQALVAADAALYAAKDAGRDRTRSAAAAEGWGPRVGPSDA
ncbi:GGDEF domain-containing protein [Kineococcus sp. SYSU DK006]|uniref:GGDEF domain-containing protein n=1 Tax=Kineococcus sp. SYSU DK006 TaxID=3383127 RepID=UPI003D7E9A60